MLFEKESQLIDWIWGISTLGIFWAKRNRRIEVVCGHAPLIKLSWWCFSEAEGLISHFAMSLN